MAENERMVAAAQEEQISRRLLAWLNTFPDIPEKVDMIGFEFLPDIAPGMALSRTQASHVVRRYISGGYLAEYQFRLVYRAVAGSNDGRLGADELLDALGDWAASAPPPDIGPGLRVRRIEPTTRSTLFERYDDGDEDHQVLMKMMYEVM